MMEPKKKIAVTASVLFAVGLSVAGFFLVPALAWAHGGDAAPMGAVTNLVLFFHIVTAVFMAWPLYALITVNERPKTNAPLGDKVDDFMEGVIRKNALRCYVFQTTAFVTGLYLLWAHEDLGFGALLTNGFLFGKVIGLFALMGLLSYIMFSLQPRIDRFFIELQQAAEKEEVTARINRLRLWRKKIAATCLSILLVILLFAVQIREALPLIANVVLLVLIFLFSYRAFKKGVPYGWL